MNPLQHFCQVLYDSGFGTMIRESDNAFPVIETVHVLSITLLFGTVAVLDLRMLGIVLRPIPVGRLARAVLPLTWTGFAVSFVSGFLLFWAEAAKNYSNPAFRAKIVLLLLVGLNPLIFHTTIYRRAAQWEDEKLSPWRARATAVASLALWSGVIVAGRAIAYF
jgi:predicted RND superfamily exporter protein